MMLSAQGLDDLASFILFASLKTSLLVGLVLLTQRLARSYLAAGARYLLWLSVVISLVTPVGFSTALPAGLVPGEPAAVPVTTGGAAPAVSDASAPRAITVAAQPALPLPVPAVSAAAAALPAPSTWLPYLWLAGVLVVLGTIAKASYRLARVVRRAMPAPRSVQQMLQDCMPHSRYSARVRVLHSAEVEVPMIAGLFRPVLLLPEALEQRVSRAQLRHIFIHELMHLRRGDIVGNWIVALVQALHWFNPLVWYAFFRMRLDRELACDAATLAQLAPSDRAAYGHTLLQLNATLPKTAPPAVALGILDSASHLQTRILMLVQFSRYTRLRPYIATLLFVPLATAAFTQPAAPALPVTEPAEARAAPAAPVTEPAEAPAHPPAPAPAAAVVATAPVTASPAPAPVAAPVEPEAVAPAPGARTEPAAPELTPASQPAVPTLPEATHLALLPPPSPSVAATAAEASAEGATLQETPAQSAAGLDAALESLTQEIAAALTAGLPFIEGLETAATECSAKGEGFLATLSAACTKTRRALRRGQVFYFGYQCYVLETKHAQLEERYRETAGTDAGAETLRTNADRLASICSKATYAARYPAFAALFAAAESLEYFEPAARNVTVDVTNRAWQRGSADFGNFFWYDIGTGSGGGGIADMYSATASGVVPINSISTTGEAPPAAPPAAVAQ